jgi:hypothetical protein
MTTAEACRVLTSKLHRIGWMLLSGGLGCLGTLSTHVRQGDALSRIHSSRAMNPLLVGSTTMSYLALPSTGIGSHASHCEQVYDSSRQGSLSIRELDRVDQLRFVTDFGTRTPDARSAIETATMANNPTKEIRAELPNEASGNARKTASDQRTHKNALRPA